jgi:signal transduction histidine kinase/CheY-like chemotaxis protein
VHATLEMGVRYHAIYRKAVDGEIRWFEATADVVRDDSGRIARFVGATADITTRRCLEEQLRQAQKMEAVGRLAGGVAHDFNNLLTTIVACTDLLRPRLARDPAATRDLDAIDVATAQASTLTRQLLTISRRQPTQPTLIDLNAIVSEIARMAKRIIGEDIELRALVGSERLTVRADPAQIHQMLLNLVVNARDAMPKGGTLAIATSKEQLGPSNTLLLPAGTYTKMTVSDTGVGMDEITRARIFEPFFTTKPVGQGTGLGLATVHAVATQLDGAVMAQSRIGEGSTFAVFLPHHEVPASVPPPKTGRSDPPKSAFILLVEDNDSVRSVARRLLEAAGHTVIEACDGEHGLQVFERIGGVDLVLTDVVMPKMGGMEMARRLRERMPGLRVVYTSGYTDDDVLHHGVEKGTVSFVRKPYSGESLLQIIATELAKSVRT